MSITGYIRGEWWWYVGRHCTLDNIAWKLAWWVPRRIALFTFIRVYACTGEAPDDTYSRVYKAWEDGAGR